MIKVIKIPKGAKYTETFIPTELHLAIAKIRLEEKAKKARRLGENVPHAQNLQPII